MVEAQRRLNRVYLELTRVGKSRAARRVNEVRNDFNSYLCETNVQDPEAPGVFGPGGIIDQWVLGERPACYRLDQSVPGFLKSKISRLQEELSQVSPQSAADLDPYSKEGIRDELRTETPEIPIEFKLVLTGLLILAVLNLTR